MLLIAIEEAAAAAEVVELAIVIPLAEVEVAVVDIGMSIPDIDVISAE
jgi:hypothetical protein